MSLRDLQQLIEQQQALVAKIEAEQKQQLELLQRQLDRAKLEKNEAQRIQRQLHEQLLEMEKIEHRLQQRSDELCQSLLDVQEKYQKLQQKNVLLVEEHEAKEKEFLSQMKLFSTAEQRSIELEQQLKMALQKNEEQGLELIELKEQSTQTNQALSENFYFRNEIQKLRSELHQKEDTIRDLQISINIAHKSSPHRTGQEQTIPQEQLLEPGTAKNNPSQGFIPIPQYLSSETKEQQERKQQERKQQEKDLIEKQTQEDQPSFLSDVNTDFFLLGGIGEKIKQRSQLSEATLTPPAFKSSNDRLGLDPKQQEPSETKPHAKEASPIKKSEDNLFSNKSTAAKKSTNEFHLTPQEAIEDILSNQKIKSPDEIRKKINLLEQEHRNVCYPQERIEQEEDRKKYFAQIQANLQQEILGLEKDMNKSVDNLKQQYARRRSQLENDAAKDVLQAQEELSSNSNPKEKQDRLNTLSAELKLATSEAKNLEEDLEAAWLLPERKEQIEQRLSENEARRQVLQNEINVISQTTVNAQNMTKNHRLKHNIEQKVEHRTLQLSKDLEQLSNEESNTINALKLALKAQISEAKLRIEHQIEENEQKLQQELAVLAELYERKGVNLLRQKDDLIKELNSMSTSI
ncbi:MAG: hypothetical protein CMK59_02095 [Proteobacteria bacterium]|nr:hypothetical protein [Pseudomonadota bacterium]